MHETIIKPKSSLLLPSLDEIIKHRELLYIFVWRDIKVRYKQTVLGFSWALFQPLITMIIFTLFFSNIIKQADKTIPYPLFVLTGIIFWTYFSAAVSRASDSFIENESLIKKVYFPRFILPLSAVLTAFVDFIITLFLFCFIILYYQKAVSWNVLFVFPLAVLITTNSAIGLGLFFSSLNVKYRDVRYILPFFIQLLLFVTPVIYSTDVVKPPLSYFFLLNPLSAAIESTRKLFDTAATVDIYTLLIAFAVSLGFVFAGFFYFQRTEQYFADII